MGEGKAPKSHVFFSLFFFYHAFIVLRYKKLRAALAIERTKPINQNKTQKKPYPRVHHKLKTTWLKPIANASTKEKKSIRKFQHVD